MNSIAKSKKPTLAIISTYDELCGIAGYTKALEQQLNDYFDITIFDLDQFFFRNESRLVQKLADDEIKKITNAIKNFDYVNIQLEHGTFGRNKFDIYKRIKKIINSAPNLCVTFHTILQSTKIDWSEIAFFALKFRYDKIFSTLINNRHDNTLSAGIYKLLKNRNASVVVHTRRDMRTMKFAYGLEKSFDHPLAFYSKEFADNVYKNSVVSDFRRLNNIPSESIILGCYGFVSKYKGIDVALKALKLLPDNYHLAIFGGLHPNEIKKGITLNDYIDNLLSEISVGKKWIDGISANDGLTVNLDASEFEKLSARNHLHDISHRVHFMGALKDDEFPKAMAISDIALLPYMEVGQSSSGPMSIAIEMGCKIIASRTKAFMQIDKYYPNRIEMFEIGNYLELAQIIKSMDLNKNELFTENSSLDVCSNIKTYLDAFNAQKKLTTPKK